MKTISLSRTAKEKKPVLLKRDGEDTYPKLLVRNCRLWGKSHLALRQKENGIWRGYTWDDCYAKVKTYFLGMLAIGLEPGDKVVVIGDNSPEWFWFQLAVQAGRGAVVAISPGASEEKTRYLIGRARPKLAVAQDQEQVDKLLEIHQDTPFAKIVNMSDKGLRHYNEPILINLTELAKVGQSESIVANYHPSHFEQTLALGSGEDIAVICYAVRGSEMPEEIVATHDFLLNSTEAVLEANTPVFGMDYVSLMNPGWLYEQTLGYAAALLVGQRLNFAENVETSRNDFREISPQTIIYPSHLWDGLAKAMQTNLINTSKLKRILLRGNLSTGYKTAAVTADGSKIGVGNKMLRGLAEVSGFRPLRDKHGLNNVKIAYAAGKVVSPESLRFFHAIGINLKQLYGSVDEGIVFDDPGENRIDLQFS